MRVSACIITLNEESNLPRCLTKLATIVDEIVIVDSGSSDRTKFIATEFNARFIPHEWEGYVAQKNFACSKASHDWVLSIDADEELSPDLAEEILALKTNPPVSPPSAYSVNRVVVFQDRPIRFGDWYPDWLPRLFRKESARFTGGRVHERLETDDPVEPLSGELFHHTYRDWNDQMERTTHYARLWAEDAAEAGKSAGLLAPFSHGTWRFIRSFILKSGWKGGALGWKLARAQAHETYLKYQQLKILQTRNPQPATRNS